MHSDLPSPATLVPKGRVITLTFRQRLMLHRLLFGELRKCSTAALATLKNAGWVLGENGGYQLTAKGRAIAELSENAPPDSELEVPVR